MEGLQELVVLKIMPDQQLHVERQEHSTFVLLKE